MNMYYYTEPLQYNAQLVKGIKVLKTIHSINNDELASILDASKSTVNRKLQNKTLLNSVDLFRIGKHLNVPVPELIKY